MAANPGRLHSLFWLVVNSLSGHNQVSLTSGDIYFWH